MSALLGGAIMAGLFWVWLDHRRRRESARAERRIAERMAEHLPALRALAEEANAAAAVQDIARLSRARDAFSTLRELAEKRKN